MVAKKFFYVSAGLLCLAVGFHGTMRAEGQAANGLVAMADYPSVPNAAVAVDQAGRIYFGHLQQWNQVATTPSPPAGIWSRNSSGEVFVALENGDLYRLEPDWTLTFDSNVFAGGPTPAKRSSFGAVKARYR